MIASNETNQTIMTNSDSKKSDALKLLVSGSFDDAFMLMRDTRISSDDLVVFYQKANAKLKSKKFGLFGIGGFWLSQLPFFHLDKILISPLRVPFWTGYFSNDRFCNDGLTEYLWHLNKEEFVKHFKLSFKPEWKGFIESIERLSVLDREAAIFFEEIKWVLKELEDIEVEEKEDTDAILQFVFGDVLMGYVLEYYAVKQDKGVEANKEHQTAIEIALIEDLDRVLKEFSDLKEIQLLFDSNEELQQVFESNRVPHKWLEPDKRQGSILPKYAQIHWLIGRAIQRKVRTSNIERYLSGYAKIEITGSGHTIASNHAFARFLRNDRKGLLEEFYINPPNDLMQRNSIVSSLKTFEFYGFPVELEFPDGTSKLSELLQLLKDFSVYKGPHERQFWGIPGNDDFRYLFTKNEPPKPFSELFGSNESISLFEFEDLKEKIKTYYGWEERKATNLLSLVTLDVAKPVPRRWLWRPFLRFQDQVVLVGSFMKDRRWENLLLNRLKFEKDIPEITRLLSKGFENVIKAAFDKQGFLTLANHQFRSSTGETGEIDLLALKDNHLYVIEAKQGIRSNDFAHAAGVETIKVDGQAAEQLMKIERYLRKDWDVFEAKWPALGEVDLNTLQLTSLIVTDGFEGDRLEMYHGIRKLSFLELKVVLSNTKRKLYSDYLRLASARSSNNSNFNIESLDQQFEWDFWDGQTNISGEVLTKRIDDNAVWNEFNQLWND